MKRWVVFLCVLIALASSAYAVGYTTGGYASREGSVNLSGSDREDIDAQTRTRVSAIDADKTSCEELSTTHARVRCRLETRNSGSGLPEACRIFEDVDDQSNCARLYAAADPCYEKLPAEKDACFKKTAGFQGITIAQEARGINSQENIQRYMIFVLYDIQEKIEDLYNEEKISSESAAEIISAIVDAKQHIFLKRPKAEISQDIETIKRLWQETQ